MLDPNLLKTEAGKKEIRKQATQYYKITHDAIRRHDPNHLILGDRYEANAALPMEIVDSALPYIDVLSFQDFRDPIQNLENWYKRTGKPVLLADAAGLVKSKSEFMPNDGKWYAEKLLGLHENPGCVGFHLCGAYQRNKSRRRGLLDEMECPDNEQIKIVREANNKVTSLMNQ